MFYESRRNIVIDYLEFKCNSIGMSKRSLGIMVRSFHCSLPLLLFFLILLGNKFIAQLVLGVCVLIMVLWFTLNGCMLSMLENRICCDEWNIVDPILEVNDMPINYESRKKASHLFFMYYAIVILGIYAVRFRNI